MLKPIVEMVDKDELENNENLQNLNCLFRDISYGLTELFTHKCLE